ncbi:DUF4129 domain-containing protein [Hymenobacter sp. BT491]|uniref:DUF4129 domain-containing protein n=1 Tax=Hymenobacter sp. BT491 TaxID=2766779 RepID=UPI001653C714|nr:DUF4129 domain-containing protein [Hymenobacter sp. BT491]MBC6990439.1 DUF4129 domain-containing protein [Hymenobacter sp. BT491]
MIIRLQSPWHTFQLRLANFLLITQLIVTFCVLAPRFGAAQGRGASPNGSVNPQHFPADRSATVTLRRPAPGRLHDFRRQRDFQYVEVKSEMSAWDLFWMRFWNKVSEWLNSRSYQGFWRYVFYALFLGAIAFVILKLFQVDLTGAFGRSPRRAALAYDTESEDIHALDFNALLAEAEASANYRLAVRLGYLQVLKQLTDHHLIEWQPDKTNQAYVQEMASAPLRLAFTEITRQFEYVWYGELALTAEHYAVTRTARLDFLTQLANRRAA